jgi:hypothetical protein
MHDRTSAKAATVGDLIPTMVGFMIRNGVVYRGERAGGKEDFFLSAAGFVVIPWRGSMLRACRP